MGRFSGKRVLITGGTSGIGLAGARRIVEEGGTVSVTGHSQTHLDEARRVLPSGSLILRTPPPRQPPMNWLRKSNRWANSTGSGSTPDLPL
jgi:NAD(P)-dependent dehydrogenase (short-subunit alcohol dehydrogenase family)